MTELQTALILTGIIVFAIIVIVSYDKYRLGRIRQREITLRTGEFALNQQATSPSLNIDFDPAPPSAMEKPVLSPYDGDTRFQEPEPSKKVKTDPWANQLRDAEAIATAPIDTTLDLASISQSTPSEHQIEFVARIPGNNIIARDSALGIYRQNEDTLDKPHRLLGLRHPSRTWRDLEREPETARFTDIALTLQFVDPKGPVTESELTRFSQLVLTLAEKFGRRFRFSMTFEEAQQRAQELDEFCKTYDSLVVLNILSKDINGFRGPDIDQAAKHIGMKFGPMNIYHKKQKNPPGSSHLYSLANMYKPGEFNKDKLAQFTTKGLTVFMNIPCTQNPYQVFIAMVRDAKSLTQALKGRLVDQSQKEITQNGISRIGEQIKKLAQEMETSGITPGSETAVRLF